MKTSTKTLTLVYAAALMMTTASPAQAFSFFGSKKATEQNPADVLNVQETTDISQQAQVVLQNLSAVMTAKLQDIEVKIQSGQTKAALSQAKEVLDDVRIKTGIDPKARLRQSFYVPVVFPEGATNMTSIPQDQQEVVIRAVRDFRGGLYLDILNLSKRTSLLYIKALHAELKTSGGLNIEDRNKIIRDLAIAAIVPMPIQDNNGKKITAFDEDVANEDHIYLFNREIKMYLLNAKDLQITETAFDKYKNDYKASLGGAVKSAAATDSSPNVNQCMTNVNRWVTGYSTGAGQDVVNASIQICGKYDNLSGLEACIINYGRNVSGYSTGFGLDTLTKAIGFCRSNK